MRFQLNFTLNNKIGYFCTKCAFTEELIKTLRISNTKMKMNNYQLVIFIFSVYEKPSNFSTYIYLTKKKSNKSNPKNIQYNLVRKYLTYSYICTLLFLCCNVCQMRHQTLILYIFYFKQKKQKMKAEFFVFLHINVYV